MRLRSPSLMRDAAVKLMPSHIIHMGDEHDMTRAQQQTTTCSNSNTSDAEKTSPEGDGVSDTYPSSSSFLSSCHDACPSGVAEDMKMSSCADRAVLYRDREVGDGHGRDIDAVAAEASSLGGELVIPSR